MEKYGIIINDVAARVVVEAREEAAAAIAATDTTAREEAAVKASWMCGICACDKMSCAFTCGHMVCESCAVKMEQRGTCFYCNQIPMGKIILKSLG